MSRHSYDAIYCDRKIQVVIGFDRPLQYFFMTIMYIDSVSSHNDDDEDTIVYSNLSDPDAGFAQDLTHYRAKLASLGITVPESLFREVEQDAINQAGNRVARHLNDGRIEEVSTSCSL